MSKPPVTSSEKQAGLPGQSSFDSPNDHTPLSQENIPPIPSLRTLLRLDRYFPPEILCTIFTFATEADPERCFHVATTISHVCRYWREIALSYSILWRKVDVSFEDAFHSKPNLGPLESFLDRSRARLGTTPADIVIRDITAGWSYFYDRFMNAMSLDKFHKVKAIHYIADHSYSMADFTVERGNALPKGIAIEKVTVEVDSDQVERYPQPWDFVNILKHSMGLRRLTFIDLGLRLGDTVSFPNIVELELLNVFMPTMLRELKRFENLKILRISDKEYQLAPLGVELTLHHLEELVVEDVLGFPWGKLTAPNLVSLETDEMEHSLFPFICRHPSIITFTYHSCIENSQLQIVSWSLPKLKYLSFGGEVDQFLHAETGAHPMFPALAELEIDPADDGDLSLDHFESLIRHRFLNEGRERGGATQRLQRLSLVIEAEEFKRAEWTKSLLLQNLTMTKDVWEDSDLELYTIHLICPVKVDTV